MPRQVSLGRGVAQGTKVLPRWHRRIPLHNRRSFPSCIGHRSPYPAHSDTRRFYFYGKNAKQSTNAFEDPLAHELFHRALCTEVVVYTPTVLEVTVVCYNGLKLLLGLLIDIPGELMIIPLFIASMPIGLNAVIFVEASGRDSTENARMCLISCILAFVTVPLIMAFLSQYQ